MKFEEALKCMREGKKVKDKQFIYKIIGKHLNRRAINDNTWFTGFFVIDVLSEDWEVVEDEN